MANITLTCRIVDGRDVGMISSMRREALLVLLIVSSGCSDTGTQESGALDASSTISQVPTPTIAGEVWVTDWSLETIGDYFSFHDGDTIPNGYPCVSSKGFDDIAEGTRVAVRDGQGNVIGAGPLTNEGLLFPNPEGYRIEGPVSKWSEAIEQEGPCVFSFEITLSANPEFLAIVIAERNELVHTRAELESVDWHLILTLG